MFAMAGSLSMALAASTSPTAVADGDKDEPKNTTTSTTTTTTVGDVDGGRRCEARHFFRFHNIAPRNFFVPRTRFIDGPGGEMTVSVTREHEVLAFLELDKTASRSVTVGDVVRSLSKSVTPHLELRHMVFTGHDYTQTISKGMYGNMWYRVFGYRVGWSQFAQLSNCNQWRVSTGIANVPSRVEGWRYWETEHPKFMGRKLSDK
ncbi:hypothetical protein [Nonomuraea lactucae]|uniref:hypothetical protein n=1 Tax=Nonomuraea lactucae TaxID=2249762 RepID=UPI000DE412C4|nr:hypothetical protein [Nonomuraea lactucae]